MDVTGTTWILVADGDQARIFEERQRAGEVREVVARHMVAESLAEPARGGVFQGLVIMAPPRALGVLRQALPKPAQALVEGSDPHECVRETAEDIRHRLRHLRAKA